MSVSYPVELHSKVPHQVRVFDAFKNLQLIGGLFDRFVIVRLKSDLVGQQSSKYVYLYS